MPTVLLATEKPFAAGAVTLIDQELTAAGYTIKKLEKYTDNAQLLEAIADVEAVIIRSDLVTPEVLDAAKNLKIVVRAGAGVDNVDLKAATDKGVVVMNTPGMNSNAVAELVFGMILTNCRNHYDGTSGYELRGKTLGLYGCGNVSRCMIALAKGFGMEVRSYDPFLKPEQIEACGAAAVASVPELFECQFVSLHIPATPETTKSINAELLSKMPAKSVLINTTRKEVIDEDGLAANLESRTDFTYVSDLMPGNYAELKEKFGNRCFCTAKKMGAQTSEANNNAGVAAAQQIVAFFEKGDVRCQVNKPGQTF